MPITSRKASQAAYTALARQGRRSLPGAPRSKPLGIGPPLFSAWQGGMVFLSSHPGAGPRRQRPWLRSCALTGDAPSHKPPVFFLKFFTLGAGRPAPGRWPSAPDGRAAVAFLSTFLPARPSLTQKPPHELNGISIILRPAAEGHAGGGTRFVRNTPLMAVFRRLRDVAHRELRVMGLTKNGHLFCNPVSDRRRSERIRRSG